MKKNIPYILTYLLCILFMTGVLFAFRQVFFIMLLLLLLMLPFGTIFCLFRTFRTLKVTSLCENETVEEGNPAKIQIRIESKAFLPVLACRVTFRATNLFLPNEKEYLLSFAILPKKPTLLTIPIETALPGIVEVSVERVLLTDLLHLFSKEQELHQKLVIPVLPVMVEVSPVLPTMGDDGLLEYTENEAKGAVSQDIKEIREYRPGDRLQRIHWKLSAKLSDIFVKEMEQTSTLSLLLLPELSKETLADTIRTFYSLSCFLIRQQERFQVGIYHHTAGELMNFVVQGQEGLSECYLRLCRMPIYEEKDCAFRYFSLLGSGKGIVAHICGKEVLFHEFD